MELYEYTAAELSAMFRAGECSAEEITRSALDRINTAEDKIQAFLTVTEENALETAKSADKKFSAGETLPPLAGIPIGIKDNICTNGILTTCASKILGNFIPPYDATVIKKIKTHYMPILGKMNLDEFAMGSSCENSYFKKTRNPYDTERVPGGSSGGCAAAVSAGEVPLALGSDTGGSIRQPASYCGNVGLKPTYGSVSRYGLVAFASSLDQIGVFAKTAEDAALLYSVICGKDEKDATSVRREYPDFAADISNFDCKKLRAGVPKEYFGPGIDGEVRDSVYKAIELLKENGAEIREISLPSTDYALSAYYIIACAEASSNLARFDGVKYGYRSEKFENLIDMYERSRSEGFGDEVKRRIMLGAFVLSSGYIDAYYNKAKATQALISREFASAFEQADLIITPTSPTTAFKLGEKTADPLQMYASDICTVTVNIAGLPGLNVPCGLDGKGLPIGMQFVGPHFSEEILLKAAHFYESLRGELPRALL
ncbi:MAG: Asp-tRNA(Asn)/Glu-tRNA(Gln) amidotransferase subunit GatA [Oscillospiraceae bacterium]|jgi:aspartyl-tRNA(Asn)/glutamyl-tRNA(Gln) amidotransferase subunit A|nr:Asp-tRNA(Asn)/Glu-tRNA(Gln) amidotransferase subunit GatA [Oscillospiraceae bacterium]